MSVSVVTVYLQRDPFIETGFSFTARGLRVCCNDHQHRQTYSWSKYYARTDHSRSTYTCKIYTNSVVVLKIIFAIIRNSVPVFISLFLLLLFNFCGLLVNIVTPISTEVSQDTRN